MHLYNILKFCQRYAILLVGWGRITERINFGTAAPQTASHHLVALADHGDACHPDLSAAASALGWGIWTICGARAADRLLCLTSGMVLRRGHEKVGDSPWVTGDFFNDDFEVHF